MQRIGWSDALEAVVKALCNDSWEIVRDEIVAGNYLAVQYSDGTVGILGLNVEEKLLVGILAQGKDYSEKIKPWIELCDRHGYDFRISFERRGMEKFLAPLGFEHEYTTVRRKCHG